MPRKRSRGPRELTSAIRMAVWDLGLWEAQFGGPAEGRAAWRALESQLVDSNGRRPEPWWAYTQGVPQELREAPARPDPREVLSGPPSARYLEAARLANAHARARLEWLMGSGHLGLEEFGLAQARLVAMEKQD